MNRNQRNKLRKRLQGAGRQVPYPGIVKHLSQWLALERSFGHTVLPQDVLAEFLAQLNTSADKDSAKAQDKKLSVLQQQKFAEEAAGKKERSKKLQASGTYRKTFSKRLLRWMGAKFTTAELVKTGKLAIVTEQHWAKQAGFQMGSKRFPPEWLRDRLKWLEADGKPKKADWSLSRSASAISDLVRWDYYNP